MPVKIRLARRGRKRNAIYSIVAADSRAPRDGKFIEKLGQYNPNTNPATIELDFERALHWLQKGAQPTDTTRAILSYKGVMMKKHLLEGAKKGAFAESEVDAKFDQWMTDKTSRIQAKVDKITSDKSATSKAALEAERKVNEDRAQALAERNAELVKEAEDAAKAEAAEAAEEAAKIEAAKAEAEAPAEKTPETAEEAPTEEKKEE